MNKVVLLAMVSIVVTATSSAGSDTSLPVVNCVVESAYGYTGTYTAPPPQGSTLKIDLNALITNKNEGENAALTFLPPGKQPNVPPGVFLSTPIKIVQHSHFEEPWMGPGKTEVIRLLSEYLDTKVKLDFMLYSYAKYKYKRGQAAFVTETPHMTVGAIFLMCERDKGAA